MEHVTEAHLRRLLTLFQPFSNGGAGDGGAVAVAGGDGSDADGAAAGGGCAAAPGRQRRSFSPADAVLQRLHGYDDLNVKVTVALEGQGGEGGQDRGQAQSFVLKVSAAADSAAGADAFRAQNAVMSFVARTGLVRTTTPVPLAAAAGSGDGGSGSGDGGGGDSRDDDPEAAVAVAEVEGRKHVVRLLTYVPGAVLGGRHPPSPELQRAYGAFVARLSAALAGFDHPALRRQHEWSLEGVAGRLRAKLPRIASFGDEQRSLVLGAVERLEAALLRVCGDGVGGGGGGGAGEAALPRQVCHLDANEQNLLVDGARSRIVGLLDWGDATHCYRVAELAIALAYGMLLAFATGGEGEMEGEGVGGANGAGGGGRERSGDDANRGDPLAVGRAMVRGYLDAGGPLSAEEADVLPALAGARIAQSLTNGAFAAGLAPGNSDYLLLTQRPGWATLRVLQGLPEAEVKAALLDGAPVAAAAAAHVPVPVPAAASAGGERLI